MIEETPGQRLRRIRREKGLSATELGRRAARIGGREKPISASAIRNQENGTNGIPYSLLIAYAEVLGVQSRWLLFGEEADKPEEVAYGVSVQGIISAGWHEETPVPPGHEQTLSVDVEGYQTLFAYEVADDSLVPTYPRGTFLICTPAYDVGIRDRDHVILTTAQEKGVWLTSIREVRAWKTETDSGADLIPIGSSKSGVYDWFHLSQDGNVTRRLYVQDVVVAVWRPINPAARGNPLDLPEYLTAWMRTMMEADEKLGADIEADPEGWVP